MATDAKRPDLAVDLCGVPLGNPFVLASGIWGSSAETLIRVGQAGAGAVTAKSCSLEPRAGHPNPTVLDWGGGLINAVGLSNPGAAVVAEMLRRAKDGLAPWAWRWLPACSATLAMGIATRPGWWRWRART
jgi:dihydroorotate dehydrogenase (NAD+) catalytic subunit